MMVMTLASELLRDAPGGVCKPGFACMLGDQLGTFRVVGWQLVELGIEALLEEALDRGAESRLAFGGRARHGILM